MKPNNPLLELLYQITGYRITCPIGNAAGIYKHPNEEFRQIASPDACPRVLMTGTFTPPFREGNTGGNVHYLAKTDRHPSNVDLNKLGFPNPGEEGAFKMIEEARDLVSASEKILGLNISGASELSIDEIVHMFRFCLTHKVKYIQVNTSCSNLMFGSKQKPVICYNLKLMEELLDKIAVVVKEFLHVFNTYVVDIKVAYFPDVVYHQELAALISKYDYVDVVSGINTVGNAKRFDSEGKAIICTDGYAGASGPGIFPIAIGQVNRWRELLPERIRVIGIGGVTTGYDVREMMYAGADFVQVASAYFRANHDVGVFNEIYAEYLELIGETVS